MLVVPVDLHHTRLIPTPVTVIRCRPHRHEGLVAEVVYVPLLDELMGTGNGLEVVHVQELLGDLF